MNYLKTVEEVTNYCPHPNVTVPIDKELIFSNIGSRLADDYCGRSLSIKYYLLDFELNDSLVGRFPIRPILGFAPNVLTSGIQIRPMTRTNSGGRAELSGWSDYTLPTDAANAPLNFTSGRFEIFRSGVTDYGRMGGYNSASSWLVQAEVYAGYLVDTTLAVSAPHSTNSIQLDSVVGVVANTTKVNFGASSTQYTITSVDTDTNICGINPVLSSTLPVGTEVTQVVPEDIKIAVGMIIQDYIIYSPNTLRQTETLDVLTDRLSRVGVHPIPLTAQRLLQKYRN